MMLAELPRTSSFFHFLPNNVRIGVCVRNGTISASLSRRRFCTTGIHLKLAPVIPPNTTNRKGVKLDEFLGSPGWKLDDLLPHSRTATNGTEHSSITTETLHHLLRLSGLPPPESQDEESNLLSALHDQLRFVRHVQSVPTDGVEPLIRVGIESHPGGDKSGVLSFKECVEANDHDTSSSEWKVWDVCGLRGGFTGGREHGWFIIKEDSTIRERDSDTKDSDTLDSKRE